MPRRLLSALAPVLAGLLVVAQPRTASAQGAPLTVEVRGGAALPVSSFADGTGVGEGVAGGAVFGVELTLASRGWRTLYAGFSQARFACEDIGCSAGGRYVATGVNLGVRVRVVDLGGVLPWVGVGGVTTRIESPGVTGSARGVSSLGYGAEVSAGLYVPAGGSVAFTPAVRYTRSHTELPGGSGLSVRYLVADLGLVLAF